MGMQSSDGLEASSGDVRKYDAMLHNLKAAVDAGNVDEVKTLQAESLHWLLDICDRCPASIEQFRASSAWWTPARREHLNRKINQLLESDPSSEAHSPAVRGS